MGASTGPAIDFGANLLNTVGLNANDATFNNSTASSSSKGFWVLTRTGPSARAIYGPSGSSTPAFSDTTASTGVPNTYMMVGARSASGSWNNGTDRQYAVAFIGSGVHRRELRDDGDPLQQLREGRQRWDRVLLKKALVETRKPDRSEAD